MGNKAGGMMKGDFTQLYSRLGLHQDCTLAEFKRAYRLRIGSLHPDKGHRRNGIVGNDELSELLHLYTTAARFHRRHGRLPGARARWTVPAADPVSTRPVAAGAIRIHAPLKAADTPTGAERPRSPAASAADEPAGQRPVGFALLLVAAVAVLAVALDWSVETAESASGKVIAPVVPPDAIEIFTPPTPPGRLELGMDPASVLAIQGKPVSVNGERWDYGPSWVRFANGQLVDWRSSPLHHLHTATPSPPPGRPDAPSP